MSEIQLQLTRRFAGASAPAERTEARLACGDENISIEKRFGLHRTPRDVTPSLKEYLAQKAAEKAKAVQ